MKRKKLKEMAATWKGNRKKMKSTKKVEVERKTNKLNWEEIDRRLSEGEMSERMKKKSKSPQKIGVKRKMKKRNWGGIFLNLSEEEMSERLKEKRGIGWRAEWYMDWISLH